jgi:prolyl-tRNA synthetase
MGCYGIGISRLAQAAVEQHHDDAGIIWPLSIAPFQVIVVVANIQDEIQMALGEEIYNELRASGIDALLDDRGERAGVKFKDADLIGIPWRVVVGRAAAEGNVELVQRSERDAKVLSKAEAISSLLHAIPTELRVQL